MRRSALFFLSILGGALSVLAQSPESELPPALGSFTPDTLHPQEDPLIPDLGTGIEQSLQVKSHWFTLKPGLVFLADYTNFRQDAANVDQVGTQEDQVEIRSARLMLRGNIGRTYKIGYLVAGEYKGFESDPATTWNMTDVSLSFPIGGPATKLTVGKTKETFCYEMVGDAANLPWPERVLNPFFVSRNVGVKLLHVTKDQRMTMTVGAFNDGFITGADRNVDVTARVSRLLIDEVKAHHFLHMALAGRLVGTTDGTLSYAGRPGSNVADNFVNTGAIAADNATHGGMELFWNSGAFSMYGEYIEAWVNASAAGDPQFSGGYAAASYVLSGETRPYDRTVGFARRVMPTKRFGATELVVRYSVVDLNDAGVEGGAFARIDAGMNWWGTRRWKIGADWGRTWLDRSGTKGVADSFLARLQWIY